MAAESSAEPWLAVQPEHQALGLRADFTNEEANEDQQDAEEGGSGSVLKFEFAAL